MRDYMSALLKTASRLLRCFGLAKEPRVTTNVDRRMIRAMLESGMADRMIVQAFGCCLEEIAEARKADFLTGKLSCSE
jgi:hypothetical protein